MDQLLSFIILDIIQETENVKTFILQEATNQLTFKAGQFLTFSLMIDGEEAKRSYSISTAPYELPNVGITMKKSQNGFASNFLFENLQKGDTLNAYPPIGEFTFDSAKGVKEVYLIGAGSGITPLFSILKDVLHTHKNLKINLVYGNRDLNSIIFRETLQQLEKQYPEKLSVTHVLTNPKNQFQGFKGRITKSLITDLLKEKNLSQAHFFICGPPQMMIEVISGLKALNVYSDQIHQEYFKIIIKQNADEDEEEIKERCVTLLFEGKEYRIPVRPKDSILESALEHGIEIPNSCRVGQCTSCRARLISGKINLVDQTALSEEEIEAGYCLTCVGFPLSDDIVIDYEMKS